MTVIYTLELLHFTDQEANAATIDNIDNLSAVLNALRAEDLGGDSVADNTLTLSSGDVIIPGLFFDASEAVFGSAGIADIQIQNELGVQAAALGNHEFDLGTAFLASLIDGSAPGDFSALSGTALDGLDFEGALFPYLSANLGFDTDPNLAPLEVAGGQDTDTLTNVVTSSSVSDVNGELIGIVGATVPTIDSISSAGNDLGIFPDDFDATPTSEQLDALAAIIQAEVDALLADNAGLNKIILLSHMQQISIEQALAERLVGVDIIVAGGSNTRLFDDNDRPRDGDSDQGEYPQFITNAGGTTTAVVNTDGNYKYVGRLVIDFDEDGNIIADSYDADVSGAYATDDQGVADLNAEGLVDPEIDAITDAIQAEIVTTEANIFGVSDVFLNGNRSGTFADDDPDGVRTQETNLGNLTADANLAYANDMVEAHDLGDPVLVSIKNGGGIRASIGQTIVPAGGTEAVRLPNEEILDSDGNVVKPEGGISQNDIGTVLAFNNGLVLVDMTREELVATLEGGVSALPDVDGGFVQLSGIKFAFDETLPAGERILSAGIFDENDNLIAELVRDGELVGDPTESFRVVTLDFLVDFGDPILSQLNNLSNPNRVNLQDLDADGNDDGATTGAATFADDGTEQDALAEYLNDNFNPDNGGTAFNESDTGPEDDERIQNVSARVDTVLPAPQATGDLTAELSTVFVGDSGDPDDNEGASEVVAHEDGTLYVTNGANDRIDVFTLPDNETPDIIDLSGLEGYDGVQSVAVANGVVAVAIARAPVEVTAFGETKLVAQPGFVALFDADTLELISTVDVGNLPDQLTFTPDGNTLLVAGEGEFNEDTIDDGVEVNPLGTVAIIDVTDPQTPNAQIIDFSDFDGLEEAAREAGIRIQDGEDFAADVEPEYITVSPDGETVFISLQENNAIAKFNLSDIGGNLADAIEFIPLGTQDFSRVGIDPNDDGNIEIKTFDNLVGFRMADAIASFEIDGQTYVATANEGDSRGFDEDRVKDANIDASVDITGLERLEISTVDGDTDGDGDIDVIHTFSSRSFSIFDADGNLVFDSGSDFERIIAELAPDRFNDDDGDDGEDRSDAKGPEPEAIAIGEVDGKVYAFIGLERDSGIMIYDVTEPEDSFFVNYIPPLFTDDAGEGEAARQSPEVITFIPSDESTSPWDQIAVSYEISGTTAVFDLKRDVTIMEIQGAGHVSPFEGEEVTTKGIVTAVDFNGYYLQDANGDGDDATSDGIFVFVGNGNASGIEVGDEVEVTGDVSEFIPGGADTGNLSVTQISDFGASGSTVLSSGNELPEAVLIGANGRTPPTEVVISDDELPVNLQDEAGTFDPEHDGIDFYESLEGMRVTIENPVAISPTNQFDETWTVADNGANVTPGLNDRSGININADADGTGDLNPERIQIQYDSFFDLVDEDDVPAEISTGDTLSDVTGVVGYSFGNYEVNVTEGFEIEAPTANTAETTALVSDDDELTVATYNVLNVSAGAGADDTDQIAALAQQIVNNLKSPDIVALQEIQDDNGSAEESGNFVDFNGDGEFDESDGDVLIDDGVLSAEATLQALVDAIAAAGGPNYAFESAVVDEFNENGGVPGGNIRNAFLYNPERVSAKEFTTLESDVLDGLGVSDPDAFLGTRDPLLGVFEFNGQEITVINNHLSSRFGSEPIFGGPQPFNQGGEAEREAQAKTLNEVVDALLAEDPDANVVVVGDFNTFEFTDELAEDLPGVGNEKVLTNLIEVADGDEAYSFNFQGNSQALDHMFVTDGLLQSASIDYVHLNVDFAPPLSGSRAVSDHEPVVASFLLTDDEPLSVGTDGADVLTGDDDDDELLGRGGRDTLFGNDGDDTINGGLGRDSIEGGDDDDVLIGSTGGDDIDGGRGNDDINGGSGADTIDGGRGADTINGSSGPDSIDGGIGADSIDGGRGADTINGGDGADQINGGKAADVIDGGIGDDVIGGGGGADIITGDRGADTIKGGAGADTIDGGRADDRISGGVGADDIDGGRGDDSISGGKGMDTINGGDGDDTISGGDAADDIIGGGGDDVLSGGSGRNNFFFDGNFGDDEIRQLGVHDELFIENATEDDVTVAVDGDDLLITVDSDTTFGTVRLIGVDDFDNFVFT